MPIKRRYRRRKRKTSKLRLFALSVISIALSTILLLSISVYRFLNAPFSNAANVQNGEEGVWQASETNIIFLKVDNIKDDRAEINEMYLTSFDAATNRYFIYQLPVRTEIDYALNYGRGPLSRAYKVGNADQDRGVYLIKKTLLNILAVDVHGYVMMDDKGIARLEDIAGDINEEDLATVMRLRNWPKLPEFISAFREVAVTDMNLVDVYKAIKFIRGTSETSSYNKKLTKYHLLDSKNWDDLWQNRLDISSIREEGIKVFVANASSEPVIPGLAGWGGRVVKNMGAGLLETDNSPVKLDENTIITENFDLLTVQKLARILEIKNVIDIRDVDPGLGYNDQVFRTPVSLILVNR